MADPRADAFGAARSAAIVAARYRRAATVAAAVILWTWHVGNDVPNVLATWRQYRPPVTDLVTWAVVSAIGAVATWWLFVPGRTGGRAPGPWALAGVLLATEAAAYATCPPELRFTAGNWILGTSGWVAVALFWHRRGPADLLVFLGLHAVLSGAVLLDGFAAPPAALAEYLMIQYGTCSLQTAFAVGSAATGTAARWAADASASVSEVTTRRITALAVHQARQERYRTIRDSARVVLAGLAAGSLDPADPEVRRRCAVEAARLRRLLAENDDVPQPLLHELRACADVAERRGVEVELVTAGRLPEVPPAARRALAESPMAVLAATRGPRARITVAGLPDEVVVSVLADTDPPPAGYPTLGDGGDVIGYAGPEGDEVVVTHHREGSLLWTETRWRRRSALRSSTIILS